MTTVRHSAAHLAGLLLLGGCVSFVGGATQAPGATPIPAATPRSSNPLTAQIGQPVTLTYEGRPYAELALVQTDTHESTGEFDIYRAAPGDVLFGTLVSYRALVEGVQYASGDWQVYADGKAQATGSTFAFDPALPFYGTLPSGRTVQGWIGFEVPRPSQSMTISFEPGGIYRERAVFEWSVPCCS